MLLTPPSIVREFGRRPMTPIGEHSVSPDIESSQERASNPIVPDRLGAWLSQAVETGASDLHLIVGYPPVLRLHGDLIELPEPALEGETLHALLSALCPAEAFTRL